MRAPHDHHHFSHAISFPASTYQVIFKDLRSRGYSVKAVEKYGHDTRYSVSNNGPNVVQLLLDFTRGVTAKTGEPAWPVGHSLGGFLSLMRPLRRATRSWRAEWF